MTGTTTYTELLIKINPEIEDIVSGICFENFPCEGVILAEETYKDLEMIAITGTVNFAISLRFTAIAPPWLVSSALMPG